MNALSNKKLLHVALCSIISAVAGCKSESNIPLTDRGWQPPSCGENSKVDLLPGLNVSEDIDGLVIFRMGVQTGPYTEVFGGEPCASALDVQSCTALLNQASENSQYTPSIIVTSGDEVRAIEGKPDVLAFLGDIDTPEKAFLWMQVNNMGVWCNNPNSAVAPASDGESWIGLYTEMTSSCAPITEDRVEVKIRVDGSLEELSRVEISREPGVCIGRMPPGTLSFSGSSECVDYSDIGAMFAKHAAYEAASVVAFNHLKAELEHYGAPTVLTDKIQQAANDEVRHAEQVESLAKQYGCQAEEFDVNSGPLRSLEEIALDNLREGCVGETWGALVGLYQADNAKHQTIRQTMKDIAVDEVGHAALSWEIHHWLYGQLSTEVQKRLDAEMQNSIVKLKTKVAASKRKDYELVAGLPDAAESATLLNQLQQMFEQSVGQLAS